MSAAIEAQEVGEGGGRRHSGGAFASPGFRWFFVGLLLLSLGVWVSDVGQRWLVQELTGSPFHVGFIGFASSLPILLFALPGGVLADRVDRVLLTAYTRGIGAVLTLGLAVLTTAGLAEVWHVALYAFTWGVVAALEIPGRQALFPSLVAQEDLMHAIALYSAVWSGSTIVGPAIAGWLITRIGTAGCFYLTAAFYALAVGAFLRVRRYAPTGMTGDSQEHPWRAFLGGMEYIRNNTIILALLVVTLLPAVFGQTASQALLPSFAAGVLEGDASTFGLLLTAAGIGALVANMGLAVKANLEGKGRLLLVFGLAFGATIAAFGFTRALPFSLGTLALVGAMNACFMTITSTLLQAMVSEEMRGRVMSAYMLTWGATSFGSLFMGYLGSTIGVPAAIVVGGSLSLLSVVVVVAKVPELARLR